MPLEAPPVGGGPGGGPLGALPPSASPITAPAPAGVKGSLLVGVKSLVGQLMALVGAMSAEDVGSDLGKDLLAMLRLAAKHIPTADEGLDKSHLMALLSGAPSVKPAPTMLGTPPPRPGIVAGPRVGMRPMPTGGAA